MYIKHKDAYGNELGYYRSIKEASTRLDLSIQLLSSVMKHKLTFNDGSQLYRAQGPSKQSRERQERVRKMITEYIKLETHPRFLAKKYEIALPDVIRILNRRANELKLDAAYNEWLITGKVMRELAEKHEVSVHSLACRINRGFKERKGVTL